MVTRVEEILTLAKKRQATSRLAVVGADCATTLAVVRATSEAKLADSILFGDRDKMAAAADELALDLSAYEVVHCADASDGVNAALERIHDGQADILCKGIVSTRAILKGVLAKKWDLRTKRAMSHLGVVNVPGEQRVMIITDAGVNVQPDLTRKRDILLNSVDLAHMLGFERPKAAILSFVEEVSDPGVRSQQDAVGLKQMYLSGEIPGCVVDGPFSLDVALSPEAVRIKGVEGEVAGHADIILMHDLGMGNILYKALQLWCEPVIASVVVGARIPIVSPSRADSLATKLNSIALAIMIHARHRDGAS